VNKLLVLPGQAPEEDSGVGALLLGKGALNGTVEVLDLLALDTGDALQAGALVGEAVESTLLSA